MNTEWIGYVGLVAFAFAWIPQSIDTIKAGHCSVNTSFLVLAAIGSLALTVYASLRMDMVFSVLNGLTTTGALINLLYKFFPRADR